MGSQGGKPFINLYDYKTGSGQWGKNGNGIKVKGGIVSYKPVNDQYVITTAFDNAMTVVKGE